MPDDRGEQDEGGEHEHEEDGAGDYVILHARLVVDVDGPGQRDDYRTDEEEAEVEDRAHLDATHGCVSFSQETDEAEDKIVLCDVLKYEEADHDIGKVGQDEGH